MQGLVSETLTFFFQVKQTDFTTYKPKTDIKNASEWKLAPISAPVGVNCLMIKHGKCGEKKS